MKFAHSQMTTDNLQTKIYDKNLLGKLIAYLKPYKLLVFVSFMLLLIITAIELALPLIIKTAVDEYIVPSKRIIRFEDNSVYQEFIRKYPKVKLETFTDEAANDYFIVFSKDVINNFNKSDLETLREEGNFFDDNYYIIPNNPRYHSILEEVEYYQISSEFLALSYSNLELLPADKIKEVRAYAVNKLYLYGLIFLIFIVFRLVVNYFQIYVTHYTSQRAMFDLRSKAFHHLQKMPLSFFDKNPIGRLVTRVTSDIRALDELLSNGLINMLQDILILIGIVIMMLILNWKLALVSYTVVPFVFLLVRYFKNRTRIIYREVRRKLAMLNSTLAEDIAGLKIIQLFNQYHRKCEEFGDINQGYYETSMEQLKLFAIFRPLISISRHIAVAIILWYGGGQILQNALSLGMLMAFIRYMERFFEPVNHLSEKFNILQGAMSGAERVFDLMENKPQDYRQDRISESKFQGNLEFDKVWLTYNGNHNSNGVNNEIINLVSSDTKTLRSSTPELKNDEHDFVLKDISFKVKKGERIALVGHTGSGKTSIINLIGEMYPYQRGSIILDGKDIKEYPLEVLRNNIGIVQQDVFLFSGTIRENIALNNHNLTDDRIIEISKYVNADSFIQRLPQKYDEPVMERGTTLSFGQRQLIAFARVLAFDPAIFVLDEATSNIDTETEILIQDALKKIMANRTSIIIAHRLSTIQNVDRIIVLHKGRIIEQGSHNELLENKKLYYDLFRLQYS